MGKHFSWVDHRGIDDVRISILEINKMTPRSPQAITIRHRTELDTCFENPGPTVPKPGEPKTIHLISYSIRLNPITLNRQHKRVGGMLLFYTRHIRNTYTSPQHITTCIPIIKKKVGWRNALLKPIIIKVYLTRYYLMPDCWSPSTIPGMQT